MPKTIPQGLKPVVSAAFFGTTEVVPFQNKNPTSTRKAVPTDSVGPVVGKRQLHAQILAAQQGDNRLQLVAVLAGDAHGVALDAGLRFLLPVLDQLYNLLGLLDGNALLQGDLLAHALAQRRLQLAVSHVLQRDAALEQLQIRRAWC